MPRFGATEQLEKLHAKLGRKQHIEQADVVRRQSRPIGLWARIFGKRKEPPPSPQLLQSMRDRVQRRGKDFSETTAFGVKELETLNTHQYKHERTTALYHDARGAESMMVKA
jgi:hypothetical protein